MTRTLFLIVALALWSTSWADGAGMKMVGQARLHVMFWPVYDSRLYSLDGSFQEGQRPLRFELEYLRDVAAPDLVEHTRKEWRRLKPLSSIERQWLETLAQLWPDVSENDVLALVLDEQDRSTFFLNGTPIGGIDDPAFGPRFMGIWLSPDTSQPQLRLALIGRE